jgi:hypothetical protein
MHSALHAALCALAPDPSADILSCRLSELEQIPVLPAPCMPTPNGRYCYLGACPLRLSHVRVRAAGPMLALAHSGARLFWRTSTLKGPILAPVVPSRCCTMKSRRPSLSRSTLRASSAM